MTGGLDAKIGITNDLTLDLTVNPDFGQVEANPSAIALDGFQIFFEGRCPFFVENKNIFDYQVSRSKAGNTFGSDNLFYSRRIGRSPQGSLNIDDNEFADRPENTNILGAAKFSGKTKNGCSISVLESVTAKKFATIDTNGNRRKEVVEPLTNYFMGRLQKDFNDWITTYSEGQISFDDDSYNVDQHLDGVTDFSFENPDFSFVQFRSNPVLRWEYIPGSEIFLVWSQDLSGSGDPKNTLFDSLGDTIFGEGQSQNIFLLKAT